MPALAALLPGVPVSPGAVARGDVPAVGDASGSSTRWTAKGFINRNGEFTVNIALVGAGVPVLGVVLAPALGACSPGPTASAPASRMPPDGAIACRKTPAEGLTVVASRSHGDAAIPMPSSAGARWHRSPAQLVPLKLCLVAAGEADLYPRLGRTVKVGHRRRPHAVVRARRQRVCRLDGTPLTHGKPGFETRTSPPATASAPPGTARRPADMDLIHAVAGFLVGVMVGM